MVCFTGQLILAAVGTTLLGQGRQAPAPSPAFSWIATKHIFSFGDSYTTTGWRPTSDLLSPDPGRTLGGGPNWLLYLTKNRPDILLRNFAEGGATVDSDLVAPDIPLTRSLSQQIGEFVSFFSPPPEEVPWNAQDALFVTWIGINDVDHSYFRKLSHAVMNAQVLDKWYMLQETLYTNGARTFLHFAIPPTWRMPVFAGTLPLEEAVDDFNIQIRAYSRKFEGAHSGVQVIFFPADELYEELLNNATLYGFVDSTTRYREGESPLDLSEYFWSDDYHPTYPVQRRVAEKVALLLEESSG